MTTRLSTAGMRAGLCVMVVLAALAGCGGDDEGGGGGGAAASDGGAVKLTIGVGARALTFGPVLVADDAGYFKDEGLDVEILETGGGANTFPAVLNGDVQFGGIVFADSLNAAKQGQIVVNISSVMGEYGSNIALRKGFAEKAGITEDMPWRDKASKLKGARIAISGAGSGNDRLIRFILKEVGLDPDRDVTLTAIAEQSGMVAAFKAGRIDAFVTGSPAPDQVVADGDGIMLARPSAGEVEPLSPFTYTSLAGNSDYVKEHPDVTQKVVNAMAKAFALINDNPDEAKRILHEQEFEELDDAVMDEVWKNNQPAFPPTPEIPDDAVETNAKFLDLANPPNADEVVNNTFAEKAAAR